MQKGLLLALFLVVSAGHPPCSVPQSFPSNESFVRLCLPGWAIGRWFSKSRESLIGQELEKEGAATELKVLTLHFKELEQRFLAKLNELKRENVSSDLCNIYHPVAFRALRFKMSHFGWGLIKPPYCTTEIKSQASEILLKSFDSYKQKLTTVQDRAVKAAGLLDWANPSTIMEFAHVTETENCTIKQLHGLRKGGKWRISTSVTNDDRKKILPDRKRLYLTELLLERDGRVESSNSTLPLYPRGTLFEAINASFIWDTKTILSAWAAVPGISSLLPMSDSGLNPATRAVIEQVNQERLKKQSASNNASSPSREVRQFKAVRTWIYGLPLGDNLAGAETWICECTATI